MFDLEQILDEVREKYYCSKYLNRPTISWSKDYITDYFGVYTFHNNHITISRALNTNEISKEMMEFVVYHESLHQDFQEHDDTFYAKETMFPNYRTLRKKLDCFAEKAHAEIECTKGYNHFTAGKKKLVYIVLEQEDDFIGAFSSLNKSLLVDFNATVPFNVDDPASFFYVFLVKVKCTYYIVGWCTNGILHKSQKKIKHKRFDDCDFSFQLESDYDSVYTLPMTCCDYGIGEDFLPQELETNRCYIFDINDTDIQPEIEYIESYCEGYCKAGFDLKTIDCISDFKDLPLEQLKTFHKTGYAKIILCNAIYEREPTFDNLIEKANAKYQSGLLDAALEDYIKAISMSNDVGTAYDIIKIAVLVGNFEIAKKYMHRYQDFLPNNNTILKRLYKEINERTSVD